MGKKICANCNAQVDESAKFCIMCGKQEFIPAAAPAIPTPPASEWRQPQFAYQGEPPKQEGTGLSPKFGVAGFILSLIGLIGIPLWTVVQGFLIFFFSIPGFAFSIPGLGKRRRCKWMAVVGLIFAIVSIFVFVSKISRGFFFFEDFLRVYNW